MPLTMDGANYVLDVAFGQEQSPASSLYIAVMYDEGSYLATGDDLSEPEVASYARVEMPNTVAYWGDTADGLKSNSADIIFPTATETWGQVRFWAICDAATGGRCLAWGGMSARLVAQGGTLRFPVDLLSLQAR
jgi:hypothetical protein